MWMPKEIAMHLVEHFFACIGVAVSVYGLGFLFVWSIYG